MSGTPISRWAHIRLLSEPERAILRGLMEAPGAAKDRRSAAHLLRLGLVQTFGPGGVWMALTDAGREAVEALDAPALPSEENR